HVRVRGRRGVRPAAHGPDLRLRGSGETVNALRPARTAVFASILAVWAGVVGLRLVQVQIVNGDAYRARARQQQERTILLPPRRGSIVDRAGRELAVSVEASSVFAVPEKVRDVPGEAAQIAAVLGEDRREIAERLSSEKGFVWI